MNWSRIVAVCGFIAATLMLAGCVTGSPPPALEVPTFIPADHAAFDGVGPGAIKGQGFLRQQGGGIVTCAGAAVYAMPSTNYFRTIILQMQRGARPLPGTSAGAEAKKFVHRSQCDAQGNFTLTGLPAGRWLVMTEVAWTVANSRQGGALEREIEVLPGEPTAVLLSDADRMGP